MTDENAALTEDATLDAQIEAAQVEEVEAVEPTESAPVIAEEEPKEDGFQKRINKVTADKYEQQRRADELQRKLDELEAAKSQTTSSAPTLEEFDHDDDAYQSALIKHQVAEAVKAQAAEQQKQAAQAQLQETQAAFNERIVAMNKPDFADVANAVPVLPNGVADALVQSENGPELIYHLGTHLDLADKLSSMTPQAAMMELGRISANMNTKPEIKQSAAPEPIEPITSGGSLSKDLGEMSMEEIYKL